MFRVYASGFRGVKALGTKTGELGDWGNESSSVVGLHKDQGV